MAETDTGDLKTLPLADLHRAAGAKFGGFAGWSMPLTYPLGVMKEHLHTREHAGLFDISHMRLFEVVGAEAAAFLDRACPLDAGALTLGQSKYTLLLNDSAGIIDDLIVTRLGPERFLVVANAGNASADEAHLRAIAQDFDLRLAVFDRVFLALQGPQAETALIDAGLAPLPATFMTATEPLPDWIVTRSGYTGEDGFEIAIPPAEAEAFVAKLLADARVAWVGLAARDSLRLEAGLCLHGQDITPDINPVDAALLWAIPKSVRERGRFAGAAALAKTEKRERRLGLKPQGRQPVRAGTSLFDAAGDVVGRVTSGGFGPSVNHPVAMGYVSEAFAAAPSVLFAEVRGTRIPIDIAPLPFTPHRYRKG